MSITFSNKIDYFIEKLKVSEKCAVAFLLENDPTSIVDVNGHSIPLVRTVNGFAEISVPRLFVCREETLAILLSASTNYYGTEVEHKIAELLHNHLEFAVALYYYCNAQNSLYFRIYNSCTQSYYVLYTFCRNVVQNTLLDDPIISCYFDCDKRFVRTKKYVYTLKNNIFQRQ